MPTNAGPPLRKVTLNLYEADCQALQRVYGRGWSTEIREIVYRRANLLRQVAKSERRTLGDLND